MRIELHGKDYPPGTLFKTAREHIRLYPKTTGTNGPAVDLLGEVVMYVGVEKYRETQWVWEDPPRESYIEQDAYVFLSGSILYMYPVKWWKNILLSQLKPDLVELKQA